MCLSKAGPHGWDSEEVGLSGLSLLLRNGVLETKAYNVVNILPPDWLGHFSPPSHQSPELIPPSRTLANEAAMQMLNKTICWKEIPPSGTDACFLGLGSLHQAQTRSSAPHLQLNPLTSLPHFTSPIIHIIIFHFKAYTYMCKHRQISAHGFPGTLFLKALTSKRKHVHIYSFHSCSADNRPLEALGL